MTGDGLRSITLSCCGAHRGQRRQMTLASTNPHRYLGVPPARAVMYVRLVITSPLRHLGAPPPEEVMYARRVNMHLLQ